MERWCWLYLNQKKVDFEFQRRYVLQEKFKGWDGKVVREVACVVDFVIIVDGITCLMDTKGVHTNMSRLKYKLLQRKLTEEKVSYKLCYPHNKREVIAYTGLILTGKL